MKLHHLGIATKDIQKAELFVKKTHDLKNSIGPVWDKNLNANLKLLETNNGISIELVEGPIVSSFIKKNINLYHICYEVEDIIKARDHLSAQGARILGSGQPKIGAHGKPVLFLHPKDFNGTLIELEQV